MIGDALIAEGQPIQALRKHVADAGLAPVVYERCGSRLGQSEPAIHLAQQHQTTIAGDVFAIERSLNLAAPQPAETNHHRYTLGTGSPLSLAC